MEINKDKPLRFWNIASTGANDGEILLYGDVCSRQPIDWWSGEPEPGMFITPEGFMEDLNTVKGKSNITIKINSCGGDLYTGIAIHNALRGLTANKTVIVEGIAASAASVIMCAGDDVQVYPGSMVMIHGVSGLLYDCYNLQDLKKLQRKFDASEQAIAEIYHKKTGIETDKLRSMMEKEKWMTGQEVIDEGFADTLLDGAEPDIQMSADKKVLMVAGLSTDISRLQIPDKIAAKIPVAKNTITPPIDGAVNIIKPTETGGEGGHEQMTLEELKAKNPDLVAALDTELREKVTADNKAAIEAAVTTAKAEAAEAERKRIQDIESIEAVVGDKKMIASAKYEKPCTAQELSFNWTQAQAKSGKTYLDNLGADTENSNAAQVGAEPPADPKAEVSAVVAAYNATKNGGKK